MNVPHRCIQDLLAHREDGKYSWWCWNASPRSSTFAGEDFYCTIADVLPLQASGLIGVSPRRVAWMPCKARRYAASNSLPNWVAAESVPVDQPAWKVQQGRLSGIDVARVVKKLAERAGLDPGLYASLTPGRTRHARRDCRGVGAVDHEPNRASVGADGAPVHSGWKFVPGEQRGEVGVIIPLNLLFVGYRESSNLAGLEIRFMPKWCAECRSANRADASICDACGSRSWAKSSPHAYGLRIIVVLWVAIVVAVLLAWLYWRD